MYRIVNTNLSNQILVDELSLSKISLRNAYLDTFSSKKNALVPEQLSFSDQRKDCVEENLLTPDSLKNLTHKTLSRPKTIVENAGPVKLLDLLAKKELASSKESFSSESVSSISPKPTSQNPNPSPSPSVNNKSSAVDRWAGHTFSNSPTPDCLPVPSFIDSEVQPTRLTFSPTKKDQDNLIQIKATNPTLTSQTIPTRQPRPNTKLSPSKKQYVSKLSIDHEDVPLTNYFTQTIIQSSPPTHDLEALSRNLKDMLNIDPIQS